MKNLKLLFALTICFNFYLTGRSQMKDKKVIKISYTTNNISDFIINTLKSQIKDPDKYSKALEQISKAKVYHTLYTNTQSKESIFVLDSITEQKGVNTVGHVDYVFRNSEDKIFGKENFIGKDFDFQGTSHDLKWKITNETKQLNEYTCRKAVLENNNEIYVWFTTDVPLQVGPYMYLGLPGLVLESNSFFQTTSVSLITYDTDDKEFNEKIENHNNDLKTGKSLSLNEVIMRKENFVRMAQKGKTE